MLQKWLKRLFLYLEYLDLAPHKASRAFLWLWSLSFYLNYAESWRDPTLTFFILFCCLATFFIKNLHYAWALYLAFSTPILLYKFPILANHSIFNLFVNLYLISLLARRRIEHLAEATIKSILVALAVVYFWAAVHKLNSDYLFTSYSCAASFMERINKTYFNGWLPAEITKNSLVAWGTIALELLIAIFLIRKKTFFIGFLMATSFHMVLAALEFIDFSMISLSIFVLALSSISYNRKDSFKNILMWIPFYTLAQLLVGLVSYFEGAVGRGSWGYLFQTILFVSFGVWVLFKGAKICFGYKYTRTVKMAYSAYVFPVLVFVFASFNYLGLSTAGTFSMFSNIRTEENQWNHLFIPKWVRIFSYQDKVYWITKMPHGFPRANREHPRLNYGMPEIEFSRVLEYWRNEGAIPSYIHYTVGGTDYKVQKVVEEDIFQGRRYSWIEKKLFFFRRVQREDQPRRCLW